MKSEVSFASVKKFPLLVWIILFGAFITRGSFYMVWPFLAVILYNQFGISATEVGLILSSAAFVSVFVGFIGGTLSDRFGRHQLMYASGILYVCSFALLAEVEQISGYIIVITLCSIAKALWEPPTSALIGDIVVDTQAREIAMQARYFAVNVGAAVGPLAGMWLGLTGEQSSFYLTAIAFALFLILLIWGFKHHGEIEKIDGVEENNLSQIVSILKQDRLLQCLIVANILCMFIYAQMDSTLIQYLTRAELPELVLLISSMIVVNSATVVCCQFLLLKIMSSLALEKRIQIGLILLAFSQLWFALNPINFFWGWIGAVMFMSLAEAILFPSMNVHIDRIAPKHLRGAYFGAASFYSFGYAFAPLGGGILLDTIGGSWLFFTSAMLCIVVIYLYSILYKMPRPVFSSFSKTAIPE